MRSPRVASPSEDRAPTPLDWSCFLFVTALLSAALGLGALTGPASDAARALFFVLLVGATVPLLRSATRETA